MHTDSSNPRQFGSTHRHITRITFTQIPPPTDILYCGGANTFYIFIMLSYSKYTHKKKFLTSEKHINLVN